MEFVKVFYNGVLGATDYWLQFEWQHRSSPHVHGLAWLPDTPDVEKLCDGGSEALHTEIITHADQLVSNHALLPDGSNIADAPTPKVDPHICNKAYGDILDFDQDLADLVATCQRHSLLCLLLPLHQAWQAAVPVWLPQAPVTTHSHHHRGRANSPHSSERWINQQLQPGSAVCMGC